MRLRRIVVMVLGVCLLGGLGAPVGALGDVPPSADLAVSQQTFTDINSAQPYSSGTPWQAPFVIGQIVRVDTTITNNGPDPANVQAQIDFPYEVADSWTRQLRLYGTGDMAQCVGDAMTMHLTCSKTLASGDSWVIHSEFGARAPGTTGLTVTATSAVADPDPTNNTAAWQYDVQCSIMGTPGDDTLVAGAGESACGLGGNDTLIGGQGTLGLWGGDGNDHFNLGNTDDVLAGGGPGIDTADYSDVPMGVIVCPEPRSGVLGEFTRSGPYGAVTIGVEDIIGTPYADRIVSGAGTNVIRGGGGNDWISGQGGDDTIYGGAGNDSLYSLDHHTDTIIGGKGTDMADSDGQDAVSSAQRDPVTPPTDPCSWGW